MLKYDRKNGVLTVPKEDFEVLKQILPGIKYDNLFPLRMTMKKWNPETNVYHEAFLDVCRNE